MSPAGLCLLRRLRFSDISTSMNGQREVIDKALWRAGRESLFADVRKGWWIVGALIALLSAYAYWSTSPRHVIRHVYGVADGAHQPQSETGRDRMQVSVRLDDGVPIAVALPRNEVYEAGARVEVEVTRRDWPPHSLTYRFVRYVRRE